MRGAMMTNYGRFPPRLAIVVGCDDIGSAIAVALHRAGFAVVVADEADPPWHRRGMAFTDAWYTGIAELDGEGACFCASLKSVPSILARRMIAATTWSWRGIAAAFETSMLVDARGPKRRGQDSLDSTVPIIIDTGSEIEAAVSSPDGACMIEARRYGRFATERRIGDSVRAGEVVGALGNDAVAAPADGVLLGLAARGARIEPGDVVVEVDSARTKHTCHGIEDAARRRALRVVDACRIRLGSSSCCNTAVAKSESPVTHEEYPQ
jgi:xanthine dehydrogenase accessory factor